MAMGHNEIRFDISTMKEMAEFLAQLEREGIRYKVHDDFVIGVYTVEITGC